MWSSLGACVDVRPLCGEVIARYEEPHRRYHTRRHLDECFERLDELGHLPCRLREVEVAIWFHDSIYEPQREDNELRSAELAREAIVGAGVSEEVAQRVRNLVLCTRHTAPPVGIDAEVLVDVDLSILGASPSRFDEYEEQIREEYAWVPETEFRQRRIEVLKGFLARDRIFHTQLFVARYEKRARINIARSLERLA